MYKINTHVYIQKIEAVKYITVIYYLFNILACD